MMNTATKTITRTPEKTPETLIKTTLVKINPTTPYQIKTCMESVLDLDSSISNPHTNDNISNINSSTQFNDSNNHKNRTAIGKHKKVKLSHVKITPEMQLFIPNPDKLKKKYVYIRHQFYKNRHSFKNLVLPSPIILNKKKELVDGYISYLFAKMFDLKKIDVVIIDNDTDKDE